jgi:hypothetical protein
LIINSGGILGDTINGPWKFALTVNGSLTVDGGTLNLDANNQLRPRGSGIITLSNGLIAAEGTVDIIESGTLIVSNGIFDAGSFFDIGRISNITTETATFNLVGSSATIDLDSDLRFSSTDLGTSQLDLDFDVSGISPISVGGNVLLDNGNGTAALDIQLNGYSGPNSISLIDYAGTISGEFDTVVVMDGTNVLSKGDDFNIVYGGAGETIDLVLVPEPSMTAVFVVVLGVVICRRRLLS